MISRHVIFYENVFPFVEKLKPISHSDSQSSVASACLPVIHPVQSFSEELGVKLQTVPVVWCNNMSVVRYVRQSGATCTVQTCGATASFCRRTS